MDFFNEMQTGELMSILSNDTNRLEQFLDSMVGEAIQLGVLILGTATIFAWVNPQLAAVTLVVLPIAGAFTYWFMRVAEERYADVRSSVGDLNSRLENNLGGIEVIKSSNTEDYEDERMLHDVGFTAEPGDTVGLVGPTGAGKTTVLKLLLRLYDVDEGTIRLDGYDVRNMTLESLRGAIGYVGQENFLFDGTVRENIRYGKFDADDAAVVEAPKRAEAHEFIANLSAGYDTDVGERGVKLSGGQRQRVAIARTIL